MSPFTTIIPCLLLIFAAVFGRSTSEVPHRELNLLARTDSSEEFDQYLTDPGNFRQSVYGSISSSFDARSQWSQCPSISKIQDQGCCDASFVLIPTAVMNDRTCITTNRTDVAYSAYDALACCDICMSERPDRCYRSGKSENVWEYWTRTGLVTESCLPYPYGSNVRECRQQTCPVRCTGMSSKTVASDKRKIQPYYTVAPTVRDIQSEIMVNGPVEASFEMYLDFPTFSGKGVYRHSRGPFLNDHSVKIIGWGTQDGTDYWLIANTYGEGWGDGGFAKFLRGQNHLGIESRVHAAMPPQ